jgi:hypothetical protein
MSAESCTHYPIYAALWLYDFKYRSNSTSAHAQSSKYYIFVSVFDIASFRRRFAFNSCLGYPAELGPVYDSHSLYHDKVESLLNVRGSISQSNLPNNLLIFHLHVEIKISWLGFVLLVAKLFEIIRGANFNVPA